MEQDRVGQKLGNYLLLSVLGKGGFATVYLGEHIHLKTQAAIKVLKTLELTDKARDKFLKEARTIARLSHPNIIRVIECGVDVGATSSTPYIVMSYAAKGNVRNEYPQDTILPFDIVLSYVNQAAEALHYAHEHNIVHCDVKPENMLIGGPNQILLADFGIANISHTADISAAQNNIYSDPTISVDIQGTMTYMSPERLQGEIRRQSDQYSLGIVVYEWLAGAPPFIGSRDQVMLQHLNAQPASLCSKNPQVSPEIEKVVLKALAKDLNQRYASVREFAAALEKAIRALPSYALTRQVPTRPSAQSQMQENFSSLPTIANPPAPVAPVPELEFQPSGSQPGAQTVEDLPDSSTPAAKIARSPLAQPIAPESKPIEPDVPAHQISPPVQPLFQPIVEPIEEDPAIVQSPAPVSSAVPNQGSFQAPPASPGSTTPGQSSFQAPSGSVIDPDQQQKNAAAQHFSPGNNHFKMGNNGGPQQGTMFNQNSPVSMPPAAFEWDEEEERPRPFSNLLSVLGNIFALEADFAHQRELRTFRRLGWIVNGLCAVTFALVAHSLTALLLGVLVLGAFWLCIRLVRPFWSMAIGLTIAAYWGGFGFFVTKWLLTFPGFSSLPAPQIIGITFLIISATLHIYYVTHRLT